MLPVTLRRFYINELVNSIKEESERNNKKVSPNSGKIAKGPAISRSG